MRRDWAQYFWALANLGASLGEHVVQPTLRGWIFQGQLLKGQEQ